MAIHASSDEEGETYSTTLTEAFSDFDELGTGRISEFVATGSHSQWPEEYDSPWERKAILSLDGGGIRGYSSLLILQRLMELVAKVEEGLEPPAPSSESSPHIRKSRERGQKQDVGGKGSKYLPCHYFDYIAGTSTGGLIAILLGRQRVNVEVAIEQYENLLATVFMRAARRFKHLLPLSGVKYRRHDLMNTFLQVENLADPSDDEEPQRFQSDDTRCKTTVYALSSSPKNDIFKPYPFRSYPGPTSEMWMDSSLSQSPNFPINEVACAIAAGPELLEPYRIGADRFYDARIVLNDPSWQIYNEVSRIHGHTASPIDVLLSLGSGPSPTGGLRKDGPKSRRLSSLVRTLHKDLRDIPSVVDEKVGIERKKGLKYYRFNVGSGLTKFKPNEWTKIVASRINEQTKAYVDKADISESIRECAEILVRRRRARSQTLQWERFATGTRYRCPIKGCDFAKGGTRKPLKDRNGLADHLRIQHDKPPPEANPEIEQLLDQGRTNSWK